jgi:gluconolactonase
MKRIFAVMTLMLASAAGRAQDMPLSQVLIPGQGWRPTGVKVKSFGGLTADTAGLVYLADAEGRQILRVGVDGKTSVLAQTSAPVRALALGPEGKLYAGQPERKAVVVIDPAGKETVLAEGLAVSALAVRKDGGCYATVPAEKAIYFIGSDGQKKKVEDNLVTPGGMTLWADGGTLVVGDAEQPVLWAYRVEGDGGLSARDRYYMVRTLPGKAPGSGGMATDTDARLYSAAAVGVHVYDPTARLCGVLLRTEGLEPQGIALGGPDRSLLFVATADRLFVRKVKVPGLTVFDKPPMPKKP